MVKDGWLTPKGVRTFFIAILVMVILGTLSSCTEPEKELYYLEINDFNEKTVCVNIVTLRGDIVCVLDGNIDEHGNPAEIIRQLIDGQVAFTSILSASEAYWNIVIK